MKKHPWMFVSALIAAAVPWAACGGSNGGAATATGTGGHATAASSSHAASSSAVTTGTGGSTGCMGVLASGTCDDCVTAMCCTQLAACNNDSTGNCVNCLTGQDTGADCTASPTMGLEAAVNSCASAMCAVQCPPPPPNPTPACDAPTTSPSMGACYTVPSGDCNPVIDTGCADAGAGAACDEGQTSGFTCYTPPPANTAALCATCDDSMAGPACLPGTTCVTTAAMTSICAKYCCNDGDCGSGTCDLTQTNDPAVGICVVKGPADAGGGG